MQRSTMVGLVLAVLAEACSGTGQIKASLTDKPTDLANVKSVLITIDSVRVHDDAASAFDAGPVADAGVATDGGVLSDDDGTSGSGWIELCESTAGETFDLMTLTNGVTTPLCQGRVLTVPSGKVSQVRLHVVAAKLVMTDNTEHQLTVPSGSQSGLKINVDEEIPSGGTLDLKIDFVASDSIVADGNGSYSLKPVIKIAK
jgi:hypothetical protein